LTAKTQFHHSASSVVQTIPSLQFAIRDSCSANLEQNTQKCNITKRVSKYLFKSKTCWAQNHSEK